MLKPSVTIRPSADIDWQMRYGQTETAQVAEFLGYLNQPEGESNERSSHSSKGDEETRLESDPDREG